MKIRTIRDGMSTKINQTVLRHYQNYFLRPTISDTYTGGGALDGGYRVLHYFSYEHPGLGHVEGSAVTYTLLFNRQ